MSSNGQPNFNNGGNKPPQETSGNGFSSLVGIGLVGSDAQPRTLYVGNLDPQVTEELIVALFSHTGQINGCKIIHEPGNDPYCFVDFTDHQSAATALLTMNKRQCLGRELKVNWATSPGNTGPKQDTSKHYHIFVGDLSPEIETQALREAFAPFGEISDCRVVKDPQTLKSKGYGFVSFIKKMDAENAISTMNGQWLGSRAIRTNWATRKPPTARGPVDSIPIGLGKHLTFDEVYQQSSPTNCTVYCGGIIQGLSEELVQKTFAPFGPIQEVRVFKDKGYAFVKFSTKEAATNAIVATHNSEINGQIVKCSWGKETGDPNNQVQAATAVAQYSSYPYQQMSYWYPQSYPQAMQASQFAPAAAVQAAAAGSVQTYPYGQYYSAAGANFNAATAAALGMQMAWHTGTIPGQPHHHHHLAGHQTPLGPQAAVLGAYPMQPYQAQ
ncbi:Nucleolysin TIAR [Halotydeus destructor]|nr:Nucleolysin TIAR [Halotydeus destructor]